MTEQQTQSMPGVVDIAAEALELFCDDLAGMFDTDMGCIRRDVTSGTLKDLRNAFAHLEAVCSFQAEGSINGSFHMILDREGSVTLAAPLTATPRNEVLAKHTRASKEDTDELHDAIAEAANLLAASWERTCRGGGETQTRFTLTNTLVGNPWPQLRHSAAPAPKDQILVLHCQMTIDPYPPFPLALIFPKDLAADPNWAKILAREPEKQQAPVDPDLLQPSPEPALQPAPSEPQPNARAHAQPEQTDAATDPQPESQSAEQASHDQPEPQVANTPQPAPVQQPQQDQPTNAADQPDPEQSPQSQPPEPQEQTQPEITDSTNEPQPEPQPAAQAPQDQPEPETANLSRPEPSKQPRQEQPQNTADQPHPAPQPQFSQTQPETQPQPTDQHPQQQSESTAQPENAEAAPAQESPQNPPEGPAEPSDPAPETGPVSDAIKEMTASESEQSAPPAGPVPEQGTSTFLSKPAVEIMRTELAWADPEDTVEAVLAKMHEHNVSHVIVGQKPVHQGILSRSDIASAMSPYLRPTFAKWRRPLDDATLRIKVKWIMSAPLTTIASDATLSTIIEQMQQLHKRALPVVDAQGAIVGMITAFDIFATLLKPAPAP